ncbi:anti-repressor SinI family protein [Mesobacillus foraminis]|nr:anti-repressor SinI family protein [Mesobacillus foraminis]
MDNEKETKLDIEWIKLIKEALDIGLTPNQIREFLKK